MWERQQSHKNKGATLEKERQEEGRDSRAGHLVSRNKPVSSEVSKATEERFTPDRMTAGKVSSLSEVVEKPDPSCPAGGMSAQYSGKPACGCQTAEHGVTLRPSNPSAR